MGNKTRILIADDHFEVRTTNKNFLDLIGYEKYEEAKNGLEAIRKIEAVADLKGQEIEMILCDWNMTPMSGFEVLKKVRANPLTSEIPFIMISAEAIQENIISAVQSGVDSYVVKPYNHKTLEREIKKISDKRTKKGQVLVSEAKELKGEQGMADAIKEKLLQAEHIYRRAELFCHWSIQPCFALGRLYMMQKRYKLAIVEFNKAIKLDYNQCDLHEFIAKCYGANRDFGKALAEFRNLTIINPENADYHMKLGELALKLKKHDEAVRAFKKSVELSEKEEKNKALDARKQGKLGEAMRGAAAAKQNDPEMLKEAEEALNKSLKLNPNFVSAHYNIMMAYKAMGRTKEAAVSYQTAQSISPTTNEDWQELGKAFLEHGDKKKAEFAFHSAIKDAKPEEEAELRESVGEAYMEKGMIDEAIKAYGESQKADPNSTRIYNLLGIAHRRKKEYDAAIEEYRKALKVDPKDEGILYNMAAVFLEKGDKDNARDSLTKALALNRDFEEAKALLSKI